MNIRFTHQQRNDLRRCGVKPQQIDELESKALPAVASFLQPPLTRTAIHAEIDRVLEPILALEKALDGMKESPSRLTQHARARLAFGAWDSRQARADEDLLDVWIYQVRMMKLAAGMARAQPIPQTRRQAPAGAVAEIDRALRRAQPQDGSEYAFQPSRSPGSAFRKVVEICYEALGQSTSPERAIRAFLELDGSARK